MATIRKEIVIGTAPETVWAALRDWSQPHRVLVPGYVTDTRLDGPDRIVTFATGTVAREVLIDLDHGRRRLAWTMTDGPYQHHNAAAQVFALDDESCRFVWTLDLLPDSLAERTESLMTQAMDIIKKTLE